LKASRQAKLLSGKGDIDDAALVIKNLKMAGPLPSAKKVTYDD
jgi:hypothetical protein